MDYQSTIDKLNKSPHNDDFNLVNINFSNFTPRETRSINNHLKKNQDRMLLAKQRLYWDSGILCKVIDLFDQQHRFYQENQNQNQLMIAVFCTPIQAQNKIALFKQLDQQIL